MSYIFDENQTIHMPESADNPVISELISNYTFGKKYNVCFAGTDDIITAGEFEKAELDGNDYVLNVTEKGFCICGADYAGLMRGFIALLEMVYRDEDANRFCIPAGTRRDSASISFRGVHLCIFPETDLHMFRKYVRSCAIVGFSHIIFEFWGMFKFDCMKELSWPFSYTKEEISQIVGEANALGVEIIPMFNHLGHASACREVNGKHVVLDQNPSMEYLFDSYGWIWNFERNDVCELLAEIRNELISVCGKGSYFHIGCDEAYMLGEDDTKTECLINYINSVNASLREKGRRCIMWHDMLLSTEQFGDYVASSKKPIAERLCAGIAKDIIIADWQYSVHEETWKTSPYFAEQGFDTVCCPWSNVQNIEEAVDTIVQNGLFGLVHTTWHTMHTGFRQMIYAGVFSYNVGKEFFKNYNIFYAASVARKALPSFGDYEKSGWSSKMTGPGL